MFTGKPPKAPKANKQKPPTLPKKHKPFSSTSTSTRFSDKHLLYLDRLAEHDGTLRSAQIQRAVGEYIERRRQDSPSLKDKLENS